jgi:hypothetical protein
MAYLVRSVCFVATFVVFSTLAIADEPIERPTTCDDSDSLDIRGGGIVVANERLLDRITGWIDAPTECLFDRRGLAGGEGDKLTVPTLPITQMLHAKCLVYCPQNELPIEAIYRERLANHGVKVVPVAPPSRHPALKRNQESRKQSLIAVLQ